MEYNLPMTPSLSALRDQRYAAPVALAAAWWLLWDLAAVWGPSLITVFGQAATTPPELMGLFALGCVLASFALARAARDPRGAWAVLAMAVVARVVLAFVPGGQVQLWAASAGLAAALAWLATNVRVHGGWLAPGVALGWLATASVAALGGTWLPVWRTDAYGIACLVVLLLALAGTAPAMTCTPAPPSRRQAWTVMPVSLVAGIAVVNAGRASAVDDRYGPALLVVGCLLALLAAYWAPDGPLPRLLATVLSVAAVAVSLYGTTGDVPGTLGAWVLLAYVVGPPSLVALLAGGTPARLPSPGPAYARTAAVLGGAVVWVLLFFAYYAGYDLGYRADAVLVAATAVLGGIAMLSARRTARQGQEATRRTAAQNLLQVSLALGIVAAGFAASTDHPPTDVVRADGPDLTVLAWNLRMGYGMDGTFRPDLVAGAMDRADVVLLSEIDRGWLLNGGQDQLAVLARLSGKRLYFAPAADPVWGDAVLTSLPVEEVRGHPLDSYGAVTGAGALAVKVDVGGEPVWAVSTHVQPTGTKDDGTIDQARDLASLVTDLGADAPVVLGGDFNFEPGTPSFDALLDAGMTDALASVRPLATSPADGAEEQIDHVFVSEGVVVDRGFPGFGFVGPAPSDHLPVMVTVRVGASEG